MAKKIASQFKLQIPAGSANPSPPVGPALGQRGVNIMEFCKAFNDRTKDLEKAMPIPVMITVYQDKSYSFETYTSPASFFIKRAAKVKKASSTPGREFAGKIAEADCQEIAKAKMKDLNAYNLDQATKIIMGSARSMGIEVILDNKKGGA